MMMTHYTYTGHTLRHRPQSHEQGGLLEVTVVLPEEYPWTLCWGADAAVVEAQHEEMIVENGAQGEQLESEQESHQRLCCRRYFAL